MAIDNPIDAVEAQYKESSEGPLDLVLLTGEAAFPAATPVLEFVRLVLSRFSAKERRERMRAFLELLRDQQKILEVLEKRIDDAKVTLEDLAEAVEVAVIRDAEGFNDEKRARYLKILGNAVRSEDRIEDLASFIRDVEMLGERDIAVLKVLNHVMNKERDWSQQTLKGRLHPNVFIQRRQELIIAIAKALGMDATQVPSVYYDAPAPFSHEEGYSICARLQGFGLAHEIALSPREVPVGEYCFRPSKRGLLLLKLIGEDVPNWKYYVVPEKSS